MERAAAWPLEYRVLALQTALIAVCAALGHALGADGVWVIAGGVCILAPNGWMAVRARRQASPGAEVESAVGLFLAMLAKLGLTIALMVIMLARAQAIDGPAFFAGLIAALIGHRASFLLTDGADVKEASAARRTTSIERE